MHNSIQTQFMIQLGLLKGDVIKRWMSNLEIGWKWPSGYIDVRTFEYDPAFGAAKGSSWDMVFQIS
ncbi:MAG: hypothetical protein ABL921_22370 [Pirellula sp.]